MNQGREEERKEREEEEEVDVPIFSDLHLTPLHPRKEKRRHLLRGIYWPMSRRKREMRVTKILPDIQKWQNTVCVYRVLRVHTVSRNRNPEL